MTLKERLITYGYDHIDILFIDEQGNQTTVPDISLPKVIDLEHKLYIEPESIDYYLDEENPFFAAEQKHENGGEQRVKGYILEW